MQCTKTAYSLVQCFVFVILLSGCSAGMQARSVDVNNAQLVDPSLLRKGTGNHALYQYTNPKMNIKQYSKIMIDPVQIDRQRELNANDLENYQKLANNGYIYLTRELQQDYRLVQSPEPGVMRIQAAIVDIDTSKPVRNVTSTILPVGIGLSALKYAASGKLSGVGEITIEIKLTDATTGELIVAALDKRVGGKDFKSFIDVWHHADAALQYWAQQLRYELCLGRSGTGCNKS